MDNSTTTRLLTLLNVSATKGNKQKWNEDTPVSKKSKKRVSVTIAGPDAKEQEHANDASPQEDVTVPTEEAEDMPVEDDHDPYEYHFGCKPSALSESSRVAVDNRQWKSGRKTRGKLGSIIEIVPDASKEPSFHPKNNGILDRIDTSFKARQKSLTQDEVETQNNLLETISSYQDVYLAPSTWETKKCFREAITLHALNHVTKKRRRVLKNNERLSHAAKTNPDAPPPEDVQDQGFTRPSVLVLLPFRSYALDWFNALKSHTPSPAYQIENQSRFLSEYGLPPGAVDKLANAVPGTYPRDHVETFKGNVDDSFRVGIKLTRKTIKIFAEFYGCDIIMASPLGLRQSIEKEKNADYLSSIEMVIIDQLDALTMQNWEHVKFVLSHLNALPKESHDTDFSRVKPWYLDGHAAYLRQSILLSAFETPEIRSVFNTNLKNVAGKVRLDKRWAPIEVPDGISQDFVHFDCGNPNDEADKRFNHFTTQLLPSVLKSAVQSANTVIFIPSYFDFIRVHNHFRKQKGVTYTVLSEYSSNQDISRARQAFFTGQKSFLLISERFHFFKRYKIRGIRNLIFYGPPDHHQFYAEFLSYPFLDDGVESSDVTCRVLYSRYDWFRLERIAGTEGAGELIKSM
ncbi:digestive organ expansion factor [Desarmillaria tabescens]|uniref:U3 small nucleolar RNA-associated protein 25 n=1 Tax=Armillaria tabescens TaxID=1929756 RepID=A0AA39K951_ARMTA|nr:digestive organ expansion factor [Desarmillaria tabescens]KAK0455529.1 digestive organ expansion factor [Desarmillaria tabescens]